MDPLAMHNLIYEVMLLIGGVLCLGAVFGGASHAHDHDIHHDVHHDHGHAHGHDHDHDHDHDSKNSQIADVYMRFMALGTFARRFFFSLIALNKMPIMLWLTISTLCLGAFGMLYNMVIAKEMGFNVLDLQQSFTYCSIASLFVTSLVGHLFGRFVPRDETYVMKARDFIGCVGKLTLPASNMNTGLAQIYDQRKNLQQIRVLTDEGTLPEGASIVITGFNEKSGIYTVAAHSN